MLRRRKPRPADRTGPGAALLVAVLARPRPQKGVALAGFVIEQVRVDRRVERGVVELEREVVAALLGTLRPSCPDLRPTHVDAVAGSVIVGSVGLGDDTDALGLQAQGDYLALEVVADFLKEPMLAMSLLLLCFEPATTAASMAICRPRTIGDAPARGPKRSGGRRCGDFLASRGMGAAQGKKVAATALQLRRSRRSRSSARSSHQRGHVVCVLNRNREEKFGESRFC